MNKHAGVFGWIKQKLRERYNPAEHAVQSPAPAPFAMRPVESSNVKSIGYQTDSRNMRVQFKSGGLYQFSGMSPRRYKSFESAPSKGKHFAKKIRGQYPVEHLNKVQLSDVLTRGRAVHTGFRGGRKLRDHIESRTGKRDYSKLTQADLRRLHDHYGA